MKHKFSLIQSKHFQKIFIYKAHAIGKIIL